MTTEKPIQPRRSPAIQTTLALLVTALLASFAAGATSASSHTHVGIRVVATSLSTQTRSWSYDWPVKPFDRQHAVRSFLNDPRIAEHSRAFHFGIDIAVPDGTCVYAVEAGTVYFDSPAAIAVVAPDRSHSFGYWHIVPAVRSHQYVARHQLIGRVGKGWGHVHFAERRGGRYLNPLRPGGLGPYTDRTAPTISRISVGKNVIVVVAHDSQSPLVSGEWRGEPLTPALLRWRVRGSAWHTIADFRSEMLPASEFDRIYTRGTRQNHKGIPGRYCFYLATGQEARTLWQAGSAIEVEASDTAGNRTTVEWPNV